MDISQTGKAIAFLRKEAGYTQATLAEALEVSDKAVSKWERGISCPDISLLPKLSVLLDTDIESLFAGIQTPNGQRWNGILLLDELAITQVYSKPMVYLLIQNFILVGIRRILIIGYNVEAILGSGERFGVEIIYSNLSLAESLLNHKEFIYSNTMIIYGNILVHGANLTRKYQAMMFHENDAVLMKTFSGAVLPIIFCPKKCWDKVVDKIIFWKCIGDMVKDISPVEKSFARGIIALQMQDNNQILTASNFVKIVEQNEKREIANLEEIALSRGLIKVKNEVC